MTLREAFQRGEELLTEAGITDARLDAWYLLEHVSGVGRAMYYAMPDKILTEVQEKQYIDFIEKRAQRIPLQHLTGTQEFMGLEFRVNEHVLIPRQDTETLVEESIRFIRKYKENSCGVSAGITGSSRRENEKAFRLLDMCTGSGCILLSILHEIRKEKKLLIEGTGADVSEKALETARENAESLHIRADFLHSDLFDRVEGNFQMIVSNPPYIRTDVIETLQEEVRQHDPLLALDGKEDGLYFYREIVDTARRFLVSGGCLLFEIGAAQGEAVQSMMCEAGYTHVAVKKDLAGLDRVVSGVYDE
ncbi:Release factor glutamine methyltransferase [[Eubacterium] contortum]|uniref:Release factor glutamine methyltransferase n=1 Tax=Faecalicatena contorta TaxID=39482 RepID=A0A174HK92_9FIRM|nr:peptide chain release factor N(5)-glutamine methyltransferase [Faecalicatena contorta]CUO75314.1 Release factor glutamine methyltransferase [[Eubacterium] contortum] [Faecalicatena contorta]